MHDHSLAWLGTNNSIKRKSDNLFLCNILRTRISKKNRQHNDQKKKYKRTNNDLPSIHIKLKIE
jgi:hypothetical protein